jgi:hypothetical protein
MASEYLVARASPPSDSKKRNRDSFHCAACCWVEVYDSHPDFTTKPVRLEAGYISEAKDTLEQLCALLPLEEWEEVFCCKPGRLHSTTRIVSDCYDRGDVWQQLHRESSQNYIYHHEKDGYQKLQLVLVRKTRNRQPSRLHNKAGAQDKKPDLTHATLKQNNSA